MSVEGETAPQPQPQRRRRDQGGDQQEIGIVVTVREKADAEAGMFAIVEVQRAAARRDLDGAEHQVDHRDREDDQDQAGPQRPAGVEHAQEGGDGAQQRKRDGSGALGIERKWQPLPRLADQFADLRGNLASREGVPDRGR